MPMKRTERQQQFVNLAATHADDFRTRVAQHDQESSFPHENVDAMKASDYTALLVPEELGGGGASPLDLALAQERLAYGDPPMAIAINMHHRIADSSKGDPGMRLVTPARTPDESSVRRAWR